MTYKCPAKTVLSVEHPGNVHNVDKAMETLGGAKALQRMADDPTSNYLELRFRPSDRFEHPIRSQVAKTANLLARVKVKDNDGQVSMTHEPLGMIKHSVRFRGMSDFQWNTSDSEFLTKLRETLSKRDASAMADFGLSRGGDGRCDRIDMVPPPVWSNVIVPQMYNYKQNPAAQKVQTETGFKLINRTRNLRQHLLAVSFDTNAIPETHAVELPDRPAEDLQTMIAELKALFDTRPMWTRRGIVDSLGGDSYSLKYAIPYVAYTWRQGPWRDVYARFGYDPRQNSEGAKYQSVFFTVTKTADSKPIDEELASNSHIFDGRTLYPLGRTYQFCDMTDPILLQIMKRANKRDRVHPRDGWWRSRTLLAIRTIAKAKLTYLISGQIPGDVEFASTLSQLDDPDDEAVEEAADRDAAEAGEEDPEDQDDRLNDGEEEQERFRPVIDTRVRSMMKDICVPGNEFDQDALMDAAESSGEEELLDDAVDD